MLVLEKCDQQSCRINKKRLMTDTNTMLIAREPTLREG